MHYTKTIRRLFLSALVLLALSYWQVPEVHAQKAYNSRWDKVNGFLKKKLPKSALKEVDGIYTQAKKDKNSAQLIKAIVHKLKYVVMVEENDLVKSLTDLQTEVKNAEFPVKPMLHSMLGQVYWQYYRRNRWRYNNRTATSKDFAQADLNTWDLRKITEETMHQYKLSLKDAEKLKKVKVDIYDEIIVKGHTEQRKLRPTLYDFLAHRAINFFKSSEPNLTKPAYQFTLNKPEYLQDAVGFAKMKIESRDTTSYKYYALTILQDLIKFHQNDKDLSSLVDADLARLKFVYNHLSTTIKKDLYREALERLEKRSIKFPISTEVTYAIANIYYQQGRSHNPLRLDKKKWKLKTAIEICDKAIARFPKSRGAQQCKNLKIRIFSKSVSLQTERVNVPEQPFRVSIQYKNTDQMHWRVYKVDLDWLQKTYLACNPKSHAQACFLEATYQLTPLHSWSTKLPDDKDYQMHRLETKVPALPLGNYMLVASVSPNFETKGNAVASDLVTVSSLSYINRSLRYKGISQVYVLDRTSGKPVAGVKTTLKVRRYDNKKRAYLIETGGVFTSNKEGYVEIPYVDNYYKRNFWLEFEKGKDWLSTLDLNSYKYKSRYGNLYRYKYTDSKRTYTKTFFFLDRKIYRPGQTVYFKGLVLNTDGDKHDIKANYKTTVTLYDVNGQKAGKLNLTTNEFGTFNGSFIAPNKGLNGNMRIKDAHGSISFSVEDYKRPKFEVSFKPVKGSFKINDMVTVTGKAKAYSGANIDGAEVTYRVVRKASFPRWYYYYYGYSPSSPSMQITKGTATTNAQGEFEVKFKAIPDLSVGKETDPTFTYWVYADVTDMNGETHSSSTTASVGYRSLKVSVSVGSQVNQSKKAAWKINTKNLNGQFQAASGTITIHQLRQPERVLRVRKWAQPNKFIHSPTEWEKWFPNDLYRNENNQYKWKKEKEVWNAKFATKEKDKASRLLNITNIAKWKQGAYVLEIKAKDAQGKEVKSVRYFTVYNPKSKSIPTNQVLYFKTEKTKAEPGEKAQILLGSATKGVQVLYEIEHNNKIVAKRWLKLSKSQKMIEVPVKEEYRGNFGVHFTFVKNNRWYHRDETVYVPRTNKELDISFETFRNKLKPGEKEEWRIKIAGKKGDKVAAEMVATLYDASLDVFRANAFSFGIYNSYYARMRWDSRGGFVISNFNVYARDWNDRTKYVKSKNYDYLNWFGYSYGRRKYYDRHRFRKEKSSAGNTSTPTKVMEEVNDVAVPSPKMAVATRASKSKVVVADKQQSVPVVKKAAGGSGGSLDQVKARTNFNETAFFYPSLRTNEKGEIIVKFTVPEALTKWKMRGFAHTKDLKYGFASNELVTQKELMVVPNAPRFFRESDQMTLMSKISNVSEKDLTGSAQLFLFDAITNKPIDKLLGNTNAKLNFQAKAEQSTVVKWKLKIPVGVQAITYRVVAKAGKFSDGEEMTLPVLTNRMLVTETMPLPIRSNQTKTFELKKLMASGKSKTLKHHKYTLEFTSNPAWYAIQALPYLMEFPHECAEQTFSRFYANSIAAHVANSSPKIKKVFDTWKNIQPDALLSNLEKNQELKSLILSETPWVMNSKSESERKRRLGVLFDLNRMANELEKALAKLIKKQKSDGAWAWFDGGYPDRYITQHIATGMGHLDNLGVKKVREDKKAWRMTTKAIQFLDRKIYDDHEELKRLARKGLLKLKDDHLGYMQMQYLYMRSFFKDVKLNKDYQKAFDYYFGQAKKYWTKKSLYMQGMLALGLFRYDEKPVPMAIVKSLKERALHNDEMGMYWKQTGGYYWYQAPIETQALMVEVFDEVAKDQKAVDDLRTFLLKSKQTQDWKTTRATTEACYALLLRGSNWLTSEKQVEITVGGQKVNPFDESSPAKVEAGTGYFKKSWNADNITADMGKVTVAKKDKGVAWGAVYWQYFEQLDKITTAKTPLALKKQLFLQKMSDAGPVISPIKANTKVKVGDLIKVRIELRVDRLMEYVHMKDMRAAGLEPVNTISRYKWQDGLGYYESTRDAATHFFFGALPKGVYVFEYALRVSHAGDFSNGVTTIQCMYAPEFASHSEGVRVKFEEK
ncbi:alpha-2-macroglobulin family protein [Microscilla marina]|uniref:alpha-2-macroglobulin family protein n=1 Tax=Microscilla marina TaxID=1027 RepID=UPI0005D47002|nr:alpha-2-macroglobulin family protein [Microscilla marina]